SRISSLQYGQSFVTGRATGLMGSPAGRGKPEIVPHLGHLTCLPEAWSGTLALDPQDGQAKTIGMWAPSRGLIGECYFNASSSARSLASSANEPPRSEFPP